MRLQRAGAPIFINSMSTFSDFSDALYAFHKLKAGDGTGQYHSIETLCEVAELYFLEELANVDEKEFRRTRLPGRTAAIKKSGFITWIKTIIDEINEIVKREADNDLCATQDLFDLLFDKGTGAIKYKHLVTSIPSATNFYRVRGAEKYMIYDRKGLFIISDNLERLTGAYRFNPSGYACLYLASNLYLAWEENRRPDFDTVNFSRFQNTRAVKILNIMICREYIYQEHFLMSYLALLCCAKTTDKDKHNFQYVVPQMIMKVLCQSQRVAERFASKTGKRLQEIDGIMYLSSRRYDQKDFLFSDKNISYAFVFPQHPHSVNDEICPYLANLFKLTEPRTYFLYKTHRFNFYSRKAFVSNYQESLFYQLEEETKKDKLRKYDE